VQLSSGLGGRLPSDEVAALHRIGRQESPEYALNHFESCLVYLFDVAPLVVQPLCVIAGIDPYLRRRLPPEA
jgi:hypothetical protein